MITAMQIEAIGIESWNPLGIISYEPHTIPYYALLQYQSCALVSTSAGLSRAQPNDCVLHLPNVARQLATPAGMDGFRNSWMFFRGDGIEASLAKYDLLPNELWNNADPTAISRCFRQLLTESISTSAHKESMCALLLDELFIHIARERDRLASSSTSIGCVYRGKLDALRTDIYVDPRQPWSVEKLARELGLSVSRFHVLYKENFGLSPGQDIISARIEHVKKLLVYHNDILASITTESGFQNEYYLSRMFHKRTGMTPGEYRRRFAASRAKVVQE